MITITVLAIVAPELKSSPALTKVMNQRLKQFAIVLQASLTRKLTGMGEYEDVVIYLSYNSKYTIRWKIVNDVPATIEAAVDSQCGDLGYIPWRGSELYNFKPYNIDTSDH